MRSETRAGDAGSDLPDALTSDQGWDFLAHHKFLHEVTHRLHDSGIRVSLFADADPSTIRGAAECHADCVELYTGPYAHAFGTLDFERVLAQHRESARVAKSLGLGINAGHDLNTKIFPPM